MLGIQWAKAWIGLAAQDIATAREELIELDREIGDADHGENMDRGFAAVAELLDADYATATDLFKKCAMTLMSTVGGAAGPLYGTAFIRMAGAAEGDVDSQALAAMMEAAVGGLQARGHANEGEKTMIDAWAPAARAARAAADSGASEADVLDAIANAASAGAEATIPMIATKGRASYLGERSAGHKDPGAASTAIILAAAARAAR